jgi:hypothetical protein
MAGSSRWLKIGNLRPKEEARFCFMQNKNMFFGEKSKYQHSGKHIKLWIAWQTDIKESLAMTIHGYV